MSKQLEKNAKKLWHSYGHTSPENFWKRYDGLRQKAKSKQQLHKSPMVVAEPVPTPVQKPAPAPVKAHLRASAMIYPNPKPVKIEPTTLVLGIIYCSLALLFIITAVVGIANNGETVPAPEPVAISWQRYAADTDFKTSYDSLRSPEIAWLKHEVRSLEIRQKTLRDSVRKLQNLNTYSTENEITKTLPTAKQLYRLKVTNWQKLRKVQRVLPQKKYAFARAYRAYQKTNTTNIIIDKRLDILKKEGNEAIDNLNETNRSVFELFTPDKVSILFVVNKSLQLKRVRKLNNQYYAMNEAGLLKRIGSGQVIYQATLLKVFHSGMYESKNLRLQTKKFTGEKATPEPTIVGDNK